MQPDQVLGIDSAEAVCAAQLAFDGLLQRAARDGWATTPGHHSPPEDGAAGVRVVGPEELSSRDAKQGGWSLSDLNGLGRFPWHTDGAISRVPPHFIVLQNRTLSEVPTELVELPANLARDLGRVALLASDRFGNHQLLSAVDRLKGRDRIRWDIRTCAVRPGNDAIVDRVDSLQPQVTVQWTEARTLIIDNWRMLHRRPAVPANEERHLRRWYVDRNF